VVVAESKVELLIDFVAVKLKKAEANASWDELGYDISEFHVIKKLAKEALE